MTLKNCDVCKRSIGDNTKYKHYVSLQIGQIVNIDGVKYEYIGYGILGTNNKKEE